MGDLQMRRGMVEGLDNEGHFAVVKAKVPYAELQQFSSSLRSTSQGRARFKMMFDHYAPVSFELQKKLSESYKKETLEPAEV
jgi:elongation factor G